MWSSSACRFPRFCPFLINLFAVAVNANGTAAVIANITLLSVPASFVASVAIENASTTGASSAAAPATAAGWAVSLAAAMASALLLLA